MRSLLFPFREQTDQAVGHRDRAFLMILRSEAYVLLRTNVELFSFKVNIGPRGVLSFLFASSSPEDKFVTGRILGIHVGKQSLQVLISERNRWFLFERG